MNAFMANGGVMMQVTVFLPGIGEFWLEETNYSVDDGTRSGGFPLTRTRLVKAALDRRWGYTISLSFVQRAGGLNVGAPPAG